MNIWRFMPTETFTPIGNVNWENKTVAVAEKVKEMVQAYARMKNIEEQDALKIAEYLHSLRFVSKKDLYIFSNYLKIERIKKFLFAEVSEGKAVLYGDFINEVNERLNIYGNEEKETMPVGVVRTALNELEMEGYVIRLKRQHKVYIQRLK